MMRFPFSPAVAAPTLPSPPWLRIVVLSLIAAYAAYFSVDTCLDHERFHTYAFDLGTFDQGIWLTGHGTNHFVTVRGLHLLGDHVRAFSFVLAPLYWIWDDVRALLVAQSIAIAAGAWFLLRIAERTALQQPWLALAIPLSWLLHPAVQNLNLDHAHPDAFASTLIVASMSFLRDGRLAAFWVAMALALSCKEDVPLVFGAMGLVMMLDPLRRRLGAAVAGAAGVYFALCMLVILPYFNGLGFFRFDEHYFLGGVGSNHTDPSWLVERLFRQESVDYLLKLGAPLAFLFLLSPWSLVPALPSLAVNLLSDVSYMRSFEFHYQTWVLPFLYIGTIDAFAWLTARVGRGRLRTAVAAGIPVAIVVATIGANLAWSIVPVTNMGTIVAKWQQVGDDPVIARSKEMLAEIPRDAAIAAEYSLVPHLAHRHRIYMFPNPFRVDSWGIVGENTHDPEVIEYIAVRNAAGREPMQTILRQLVDERRFELVAQDAKIDIYRRIPRMALSERASCADWDGNGVVTLDDMYWIADAIMKGRPCPLEVCDADGDGKAAYSDVIRVSRRAREGVEPACPPAAGQPVAE